MTYKYRILHVEPEIYVPQYKWMGVWFKYKDVDYAYDGSSHSTIISFATEQDAKDFLTRDAKQDDRKAKAAAKRKKDLKGFPKVIAFIWNPDEI